MHDFEAIESYLRAANYLTVAQIFLRDNFLLERPLSKDDVKPRLLGHWGTGPGINLIYGHLSQLIKQHHLNMMFVLGPGHGFPALQANLFLEQTLQKYYPNAVHSYEGIAYLCQKFSWPYGFPSHSNPGTPGVILEGGELGYSLSTSYGAVLDNKDLIVACLVGDGEAETGPTAAAWHLNKLLDPAHNGAVLPILHLNGYKISGPTIFGRMTDEELLDLFRGYGYQPRIVQASRHESVHQSLQSTLEWAVGTIKELKRQHAIVSPRFPMIILRTPKGWTGVKELNGQKVEGNFLAHQVVLTEAHSDDTQLRLLDEWLKSYKIQELFNREKGFGEFLQEIFPSESHRMGLNKHTLGGEPVYKPLELPDIEQFAEDAVTPGTIGSSSMRRAGLYLGEVFRRNQTHTNFRVMSPDETYSNKLDDIFAATSRAWVWPSKEWDKDMSKSGRVMELLSEHSLQGLAQGYVLTGRHAVFASYEAFIQVITSMMDQYAKFLRQAIDVPWRGDIASFNYILTSSGWRQEHNGFSHQNPGFIDDALQRQGNFVNVYLPPDGNTTLAALEQMLSAKKQINILIAGKTLEPRWLTPDLARRAVQKGVMVWDFASDNDPDIVFAAAGDYLTKEALAAIDILKSDNPNLRVRFVSIVTLSCNGLGHSGTEFTHEDFKNYFTLDKPVICNFHGYPQTLKSLLFDYSEQRDRFTVHGYKESGSTTTPFDMHVRNQTDRYHLVMDAVSKLAMEGKIDRNHTEHLLAKYHEKLAEHTAYIKEHGVDLPEIEAWQWKKSH